MYIFPKHLFYVTFDLCPNLPFPYTINGRYQTAQLTRRVAAVLLILPPILWLYANAPPAYIFHMRVILRQRVFFDFDSDGRGCNLRCILVDIHSELVDLRPFLCYFATLSLSRHISIEDQKIIFWAFAGNFGSFWKLGGSFFHIFNHILSGSSRQDISLKAYFNCLKAFDICQESIWTVQTVSEQYLSLFEMFPIFHHMFSHCKNFWIALLPRYHGLELSMLFSPFTLDVINFLKSWRWQRTHQKWWSSENDMRI